MIRSELYINNTRVELNQEVQASITYQIADIRMPDKRQGSFSKTVSLPGSPTINNLFTSIFDLNTSVQTSGVINFAPDFNPNLKASFVLLVEGIEQFRGYMKLQNITRIQDQLQQVMYEVNLFGDVASIFGVIGDAKLNALDLSAYDHTYNKATQKATWTAAIGGAGYVYPMINYGGVAINSWDVNDFYPAIYVKTYIDEIFDAAGYSYTSTFFSSSYFKHLIVPFAGDKLTISAAQVTARLFSAKTSLVTTVYSIPLSIALNTTPLFTQNLIFDNEISDPSNQYNPVTGVFTVANTGFYQFNVSGLLSAVATTGGFFTNSSSITHNIYLIRNNNASTFGVATVTTNINNTVIYVIGTPLFTNVAIAGSSPSFAANAGDVITFKYTATNNGLNSITGNIPIFSFSFNSLSTITNSITNPTIVDGFPLQLNSTLPIDIKQSDFLMSVIRMFNLFVETDKNDSNNLIIDTYDSFYGTGTTQDWSKLLDVSKPVTITPMGALDARRYTVKYTQDTDFWNKRYFEKYNKTYGEYNLDITNDFLKNENKNEVLFAPTPSIGTTAVDRIIPEIYTLDSTGLQTRLRSKLRILYWDGAKATVNAWSYTSYVAGTSTETTYPFSGHIDNPISPTTDLSFGVPNEIYYVNPYGQTSYTNNNLFNQYHKLFIDEITDVNSKIVTAFFRLQPLDILILSFRNKIYIDGQYYRLNKVIDYNPLVEGVTKCELLKIKNGVPFVQTTAELTFTSGEKLGIDKAPSAPDNVGRGDITASTNNVTVGRDNYISPSARYTLVNGSNNFVGNDAASINISASSGVSVLGGLTNVTVINTNDIVIRESNITYINGVRMSGSDNIYTASASQTISALGTWECTSPMTLTLDVTLFNTGDSIRVKNVGGGATVIIDGNGILIDGSATQVMAIAYDTLEIYYNGTVYFIR
jgi:hypothetical protein